MSISQESDIYSGFYLPHHAVIKADSTTTKTRVVFDGSCKTSTGISLNDTLMVGPKLQDDLFVILVRYRSHIYALTADIEKMYRQILVHPDDVKYQKILFRESRDETIKFYTSNTVTYGTSAGSYLAIKSLQQLGKDERESYPNASVVLQNDFYVDDLLSGAETLPKAKALRNELNALLAKGGFHLRKWASNHPSLSDNASNCGGSMSKSLDSDTTSKTLGIHWRPSSDTLCYSVKISDSKATKRAILLESAKLFDPLGLLGPVIVYAKIMMQLCWKSGITWDESVPQEIHNTWELYKSQLPVLETLRFTRCLLVENASNLQIHGFCDASEKAYGACIYLRSTSPNGKVYTRLICSKSRVAPVNSVSLPRLELCGALLLSTLYNAVRESFTLQIGDTYLWCDSTISLHWIHTAPYRLKTFVSNRVAKIQKRTVNCHWWHIPSADNPADFVSRGQLPAEFAVNAMWQTGPSWLTSPEQAWPRSLLPDITIPELKSPSNDSMQCMQITLDKFDILHRYSSMRTLQRVVAYNTRFLHNLKNKNQRITGNLTAQELKSSLTLIIKLTQSTGFLKEMNCLKSKKSLPDNSNLLQLSPYLDDLGIMRVGGQLSLPSLHNYQQHPMLLPSNHFITTLIVREEHARLMHAGAQATLYSVRQNYWPINSRNTVRKILHQCGRCFRAKPRLADYSSGLLPKCRIEQCRPFLKTGIDFCGPLFIKEKRFRNRNKVRVYVAVFVFMVTKAVHLELVCDFTSEAFIASLRRFFARCGKSAEIHSNNGTNFVGACREIREFFNSSEYQIALGKFLNDERITWHFIPPRAPYFGGLWEAAVK
ncbi:uncharacterized protein LOC123270116 [Cotesia glomerata]|uniref:uncharacterized protein LOC123270116 n=1 Tax=Cotesia glomerata TaxID=32391 RepID=UPI001D023808|nr:uncharacterized protein LOC123270116 [Cotesia glomerata]